MKQFRVSIYVFSDNATRKGQALCIIFMENTHIIITYAKGTGNYYCFCD